MRSEALEIAEKLTPKQRAELLNYEDGEGFMPPLDAVCARRMWKGIMPRGIVGPLFLLKKAHGACLYAPLPLGRSVAEILQEQSNKGEERGR